MDDLARELGATSFTNHAIQPVMNNLIGEEEDHMDSCIDVDDYWYNEDTVNLLPTVTGLKLKLPMTPRVGRPGKDKVKRSPDGFSGRPKLLSWASEMSMYDGCSPRTPCLPKNLPNPRNNLNLKIMYKKAFCFPEHPRLAYTAEAGETTDEDDSVQSTSDLSDVEQEDMGIKGRPVMSSLEAIDESFVTLEAPSSMSSQGFIGENPSSASLPSSCKPKGQTVLSNSSTSTDSSSSSQNSAHNELRSSPTMKPFLSSRFAKPNRHSSGDSRGKPQSSSKRNMSNKGQNWSSKSKGRSKKPSGEKRISAPVFDFQNLIINYLPPKLNTAELRQLFERFGCITNCKVVADHDTGLSKGYGFVKFQTRAQAEKAIEELNHYQIRGKTLKVSYARRTLKQKESDGRSGKVQHKNLYIANLDKHIESSDLQEYFGSCGYIVQCRVLKNKHGATRRIGFVRYDTHESALKAIKRYDGKKMYGSNSVIQVRFANSPRAPPNQSQSQSSILPDEGSVTMSPPLLHNMPSPSSLKGVKGATSLNGMLPNVYGQGLIEVGGQYAPLTPANMRSSHRVQYTPGSVMSRHAQLPQGIYQGLQAVNTYGPRYIASQRTYAPQHQQGSLVTGVMDQLQLATKSTTSGTSSISSKKSNTACYISGIDIQTDESTLKTIFGGKKVKSVRIIRRRAGPYAFVNYFNFEDAAYAVETYNNSKIGSQTITVRLKKQ